MLKRSTLLPLFIAALGITVPALANAHTVTGRVTGYTPTSISLVDREAVTVAVDSQTTFSKLITKGPWQQSTTLPRHALRVGSYVIIHFPKDTGALRVARWVRIGTDVPR